MKKEREIDLYMSYCLEDIRKEYNKYYYYSCDNSHKPTKTDDEIAIIQRERMIDQNQEIIELMESMIKKLTCLKGSSEFILDGICQLPDVNLEFDDYLEWRDYYAK